MSYKTPQTRVLFGRCHKLVGLLVFGVFLFAAIFVSVAPKTAQAATNSNLNFQARLMTAGGGIVPDGNYNIEFKLYNAATSGTSSQGSCTGDANCLWTETRTSGNVVTVKNGYLTVNLGSVTALPAIDYSQQLWLTMRVGGTGTPSWDTEMSPRLQLTATPYAFKAGDSATLGGLSSSGFIQNTTSPQATSNFNISGSGVAGTSLVTPLLDTASAVTLNIGTSASGISLNQNVTLASGKTLTVTGVTSINNNTNAATSINTGSSNALVTIGGGFGTFSLQTTNIDISAAGAITGATGITSTNAVQGTTLVSTVAIGTAPLTVTSTTKVANLNADLLDGLDSTAFAAATGSANYIQNTTSAQTANIAVKSAAGGSIGALIQGATSQTADVASILSGNTSGTITNNLLINRDVAGGTTTNGINITNTAGTLTNGLAFTGTIGADINRASGTLSINGASGIDLKVAGTAVVGITAAGASVTGNVNASTNLQTAGTNRISNTGALSNVTGDTSILTTGTLGVARGGTGAGTFTTNGVLFGNGTGAVGVTAAGSTGQCIKATTGSAPTWGTCGTASSLQDAYDTSGTSNPQILLSSTNGGVKIADGTTPVTGNLFQLVNNANTATYFGVSASAVTLQDSSGNNAFIFDSTSSHLKVYANTTTPTLYADIYYDSVAGEAVFAASSGTTRVGNGSGNISLVLSNVADGLLGSKTATPGGAYSSTDFSFTRNLTGGANALTGNVFSIEDLSSGSNVASNVLSINQNNTGATGGNLIMATKGGAGNTKFKVDTNGTTTIAAGQSYTGVGAVSVTSGGSGALTLTSQAAATWSTATGNLTLTAGGANAVIVKPGTNSATAFQVQPSGSTTPVLDVDTSNGRVGIGTAAPATFFHVAASMSSVATSMALLEQTGAGDSTLEFKNSSAGSSFYVGNNSNTSNSFNINSYTAATTTAPGTITLVQSAAATGSGASPLVSTRTKAFTSNNTLGNLIVVAVSFDTFNTTTWSCSDSQGNTYATAAFANDTTNDQATGICYAKNIHAGANTVTLTIGQTTDFVDMSIYEYSGADTTAPLDVASSNFGAAATGTDAVTSGSATTTQSNDLVFGATRNTSGTNTITAGSLFTGRIATSSYMLQEDKTLAAAGSTAATFTYGSTNRHATAMAAFKGATVGGSLTDTYANPLFTLSQTGSLTLQNTTNSSSAFVVNTSGGAPVLSVDTTDQYVQIGSATTNSTATLLILDSYSTSTDPTGVNGAMYYNTSLNAFRCYENGAWYNCLTHHIVTLAADVTNSTACTIADVTGLSFPVTSGVTYRFHAHILYTAAATTTGSRWAVNGPASPTILGYTATSALATGYGTNVNTTQTASSGSTYDIAGCSASSATTAGNLAQMDGIIKPSASGTLTVRFASEISGSAVVAKAGSTVEWW